MFITQNKYYIYNIDQQFYLKDTDSIKVVILRGY